MTAYEMIGAYAPEIAMAFIAVFTLLWIWAIVAEGGDVEDDGEGHEEGVGVHPQERAECRIFTLD